MNDQAVAPESFLSHLTVFILAIFIGFQVVWNVKPAGAVTRTVYVPA